MDPPKEEAKTGPERGPELGGDLREVSGGCDGSESGTSGGTAGSSGTIDLKDLPRVRTSALASYFKTNAFSEATTPDSATAHLGLIKSVMFREGNHDRPGIAPFVARQLLGATTRCREGQVGSIVGGGLGAVCAVGGLTLSALIHIPVLAVAGVCVAAVSYLTGAVADEIRELQRPPIGPRLVDGRDSPGKRARRAAAREAFFKRKVSVRQAQIADDMSSELRGELGTIEEFNEENLLVVRRETSAKIKATKGLTPKDMECLREIVPFLFFHKVELATQMRELWAEENASMIRHAHALTRYEDKNPKGHYEYYLNPRSKPVPIVMSRHRE